MPQMMPMLWLFFYFMIFVIINIFCMHLYSYKKMENFMFYTQFYKKKNTILLKW